MQAIITGGRVFYGRTVKVSDFEPKRAEVELTFGAPDGVEVDAGLLDSAASRVVAKVNEMLGLTAAANGNGKVTDKDRLAIAAGGPATDVVTGAANTATAAAAAATTRKPRTTKPPAVPAGEDPAAMGGDPAPAKTTDADPASVLSGEAAPATTDAADLGDDDLLSGSVPEVTDEALTTAITKKNAAVKNPVAIRALIGRYTPQDGKAHQAREIEQTKRTAFITELEAVKPLI